MRPVRNYVTVSILAQPEGWALPHYNLLGWVRYCLFQSSPSPKAGRCMTCLTDSVMLCWFQSSPSPKAGRCHERGRNSETALIVSILAQPEGWALRRPG